MVDMKDSPKTNRRVMKLGGHSAHYALPDKQREVKGKAQAVS
jgi:hypothetical protein